MNKILAVTFCCVMMSGVANALPQCGTNCSTYCEGKLYSGGALTPICVSACEAESEAACEVEDMGRSLDMSADDLPNSELPAPLE